MSRYFEKGREPVSSYTHFWGALARALGTLALAARSLHNGTGGMVLAGVVLFGLSLVALYSASSIYHYALGAASKVRRLRKLDHAMIYVLIAGSYTPLCVKFMDPAKLPVFLGAMWAMAAAGILLKLLWLDAPRWLGTLLYLALGWAIVVDLPAFAAMPAACLGLVAAGGVCYSLGAVLYMLKWPNLSERWGFHELFHLFILAGSACHFAAVFFFVA